MKYLFILWLIFFAIAALNSEDKLEGFPRNTEFVKEAEDLQPSLEPEFQSDHPLQLKQENQAPLQQKSSHLRKR